ncbi:unnamed protein product [Rotaria sordida]|uniref:BEN domain-containing protein n=2 Tax=Rotaria sordida TaxID=392033 RepID=A0A819NSK6_9BILA|nr:unnamed protein product [Rotaria sordida]
MQRCKSIESITSATSSCRGGEKKTSPTHMLIQNEIDNKILLLPVAHLVNSSVTRIKINATATFKKDIDDRKQHRGKIIQLGTKEICMEQLQVFEMTADANEESTTDDEINQINKNEEYDKKKCPKKQQTASRGECEYSSTSSNSSISVSSKNQTTNIMKKKHDMKSKLVQIDEGVNESNGNEDQVCRIATNNSSNDKIPSTKSIHNSSTIKSKNNTKASSMNVFQTEHRNESSQPSNSQIIINAQPRSVNNCQNDATVLDFSSSGPEERLFDISNTELLCRYEYLSKRCNELSKENADLSRECDRLTQEIQMLKRTTMRKFLAIPDAAGRQWFINMGKFFANKAPDSDISKYATALDINDPRDLIDCIEDTTSNTARQVIRLLYSPNQLLTMTGTEVPKNTRLAIREFAESQKGPISKRQFNEAINGVFRATKCEVKKKKKKENSLMHQRSTSTDLNSNKENHNGEEDPTDTNDGSQDVSDMHEDQMWLEECVDNDPWKNVEIAPMFQYPVMENDFLSDESSQTPPEKDIAAALVLLKIRHRISTKGIDDLCKLLKMLKMSKAPKSFYRIKRLLLPNPSAPTSEFVTYICPVCCEATTSLDHCSNEHCTQHKRFHAPPLYYLRMPILQQLREILDHAPPLNFEQQQEKSASNSDVINDIYDAEAYQNILKKEAGKKFLSLIMNVDGIQIAKNSNLSLWIFTFVINEVKRSERFRLKNVIVGGIVSAVSKPDRHQMQALLSPIVKELLVLEQGEIFTVRGLNESSKLHLKTFLIASCCDKPAQSLVQGISEPTGAFGCGRCELQGETVAIKKNSRKKIRVFPLIPDHQGQPRLRTNKTYDIFMKVYAQERSVKLKRGSMSQDIQLLRIRSKSD